MWVRTCILRLLGWLLVVGMVGGRDRGRGVREFGVSVCLEKGQPPWRQLGKPDARWRGCSLPASTIPQPITPWHLGQIEVPPWLSSIGSVICHIHLMRVPIRPLKKYRKLYVSEHNVKLLCNIVKLSFPLQGLYIWVNGRTSWAWP